MFTTYFDDPERIGREADYYLELQREDLLDVAAHFLDAERRFSLAVVPEGPESG